MNIFPFTGRYFFAEKNRRHRTAQTDRPTRTTTRRRTSTTPRLEKRLKRKNRRPKTKKRQNLHSVACRKDFAKLSGRLDSNQRPPTPEAGALTGLRYTPNCGDLVSLFPFPSLLRKKSVPEASSSGYQDSNLGPPAPKAGALTGLRYTPFPIRSHRTTADGRSPHSFTEETDAISECKYRFFFVYSKFFSPKNHFHDKSSCRTTASRPLFIAII